MLALSVKQPWAELIARGKKKKDFRTWTRSCFGELLIVASKSVEADDIGGPAAVPAATSKPGSRAFCDVRPVRRATVACSDPCGRLIR